ncbi:AraC family transcriptional regulator [Paenibacillus gorillae]|uniref:AraC family transcriptional regulator n=1 Tax=Paenibacillus gorillae TaxID=1243662 RepID=UPI0005AAA573|nr:AraC family transcriptional regulator [Paenibacillus gorillae]
MNLSELSGWIVTNVTKSAISSPRQLLEHSTHTSERTLFVVIEGKGTLHTLSGTFPLKPGIKWICLPDDAANYVQDPAQRMQWIQIRYRVSEHFENENDGLPLAQPAFDEQSVTFANALYEQWSIPSNEDSQQQKATLLAWLMLLLDNSNKQKHSRGASTAISRVIEYMERAYSADIQHRELSTIAGMTSSHFSFAFRKRTGHRPMDYLADLRIGRAKQFLHSDGLNVKETAQKVGFTDEYYFSRRFKQRVGVSPAAYVQIRKSAMRTISLTYTGQLLAVGLKPLGAFRQHLANQSVDPLKMGIADVGDFYHMNLESIASLSPDLIVTAQDVPRFEQYHMQLKRIAPIAVIPWEQYDVFGHLRHVAGIVDKEKEAEKWISLHFEQAEQAREAVLPYVGKEESVSLFRISGETIGLWGGREFGHVLYQTLGLKPPATVSQLMDEQKNFNPINLRLEEMKHFAGDIMFISVPEDSVSLAYLERLMTEPAWKELKAVRTGNICRISDTLWKFYEPRAITEQLKQAVNLLRSRKSS